MRKTANAFSENVWVECECHIHKNNTMGNRRRREYALFLRRSSREFLPIVISDHREILLFGPENNQERNRTGEGEEPPVMLYCQSKKVKVG